MENRHTSAVRLGAPLKPRLPWRGLAVGLLGSWVRLWLFPYLERGSPFQQLVAFDQRYPDGITRVMQESQRFYRQELGKTFKLNNPTVEVVTGDHDRAWYENTANGDEPYWWVIFNMQRELMTKLGLRAPDSRWLCVGEISAEKQGVSGGGGGGGWVILSGHDADGAAGTNGAMNRWYGGMVHELGHVLGLPDSTYTDGTPMSASFYDYPNCHFSQAQKNGMLNGPYGSFLS
ncbi:hypothetical protein [Streptomyces sparsogenes]|uniref:hypothetical protein n=1 Tax=Streptomyces sparsogenes TaxID=67365 RepID=UPI000AEBF53B|nr:hypothetical protein [Streptomyces sparsogenes]